MATYVAPSRISGVGLFAACSLHPGTRIWEFTEGVDWHLTADELSRFPDPFQERFRHYVYRNEAGLYVLCGDNAKFMNHDPDPNCSDADPHFTITVRAIAVGEELTCDYGEFDYDAYGESPSFAQNGAAPRSAHAAR